MQLLQGVLVEPIGNFLYGAVSLVGDLCRGDTSTLMVYKGLEVHQVIVLAEDIGTSFIVYDAWVVAAVALRRAHDVSLALPGTCRRVTHGIAQCLWAAGGGIAQIVVPIAFVEPGSFLIMVYVIVELYDVAFQ